MPGDPLDRARAGRDRQEHPHRRHYVGPFTSIYHDCVIEDTEIEHSLVLEHSVIHGVGRIEDSLIGRYVVDEALGRACRAPTV